jgi:hypothetical protein
MVVQGFETPRKVNDLGAGVAAGALLLGQGLVGLLTAKPARIALQPMDGSKGAVIDIPVVEAKELSLLSKETAVVLAAGGDLIALLDLQSAVKPRPIAREVRALSPRPFGESAFAVGDEGKAMALTLSRNDVGVRTFSMKGALHACDIGEHVTYAIVDDDRGRQLRVHTGASPELGTSVRVALPEGALDLDRVRGSQLLSAVYKRGDERVCLVQGSAKPQAKMIRLEAKPADVAVLDGCLLVAFFDGRLALYDRDAIEGAGDTTLPATALMPLGAQGRPRVILAASGKGSASLWVGTTAGEVFRAGLALTAEAVSQPQAPSPSPAVNEPPRAPDRTEELLARERELEELRAEVAQMQASHAAELEKLGAEAEQAKASHAAELAKVGAEAEQAKVSHAAEIEALRVERSEALEELRAAHRKALEERDTAHRAAIEAHNAAHQKAIEAHNAAHQRAIEEHDAAHQRAIEEHDAAHRKAIEEHDATHSTALEDMRRQLAAADARERALEETSRAKGAELDDALAKLRAAEEQVRARTAERDLHQRDLEEARAKLTQAEGELTSGAAERKGLTEAIDRMRSELEHLVAARAEERERIEKLFPFGSEGLRSFERARGKLDSLITRIQGVVFKRPGS